MVALARSRGRVTAIALAAYVVVLGSLATPLYAPLPAGRNDSWALLVLVAAAHVGLGAAVGRAWVLAVPGTLVLVWLAANVVSGRATGLDWLAFLVVAPVLLALTALGLALGRGRPGRGAAIASGCFGLAVVPAGWAAVETLKRGPPLPRAVQAQLPTDISLGNLCPDAESPPELERRLRHDADVLIRELRRRPNRLVTYTYVSEEDPEERRAITVRELAEEQLKDIESNGPHCDPALEHRIRAAM